MNLIEKYNLKVGEEVTVYPTDNIYPIIGIVGEINEEQGSIYIFNNKFDGSRGLIDPRDKGYLYSWTIPIDDDIIIEKKGIKKIDVRKLNKQLCSKKEIK